MFGVPRQLDILAPTNGDRRQATEGVESMSHPRICPCPNCVGIGAGSGRLLFVVASVAAAVAFVELCRLAVWAGKAPMIVIAAFMSAAVITGVVLAIRGSIRDNEQVTARRRSDAKVQVSEVLAREPDHSPTAPPAEPEYPPLRLIKDRDVA